MLSWRPLYPSYLKANLDDGSDRYSGSVKGERQRDWIFVSVALRVFSKRARSLRERAS